MKPELRTTADGSHTLYVKGLDEHYHSIHGALTESRHVFINAGLKQASGDPIRIFEMGFGTGLNAILTLLEIRGTGRKVHYTGLEKYPLGEEIISSLNYPSLLPEDARELFVRLHRADWNKETAIGEEFILEKVRGDLCNLEDRDRFDLVYFDAFAPDRQPELWTQEIFSRVFRSMSSGSVLTTYSSKGLVRRNLAEAGFLVEKLAGPPGKRDMTRAWKE